MSGKCYVSPVAMAFGSIYDNMSDEVLEHPAFILDAETGTLHVYGNIADVRHRYDTMINRMSKVGMSINGLLLVEMDNLAMSREEQCYVLKRCIEYTASSFQRDLCIHLYHGDVVDWVRSEMVRFPLDLTH